MKDWLSVSLPGTPEAPEVWNCLQNQSLNYQPYLGEKSRLDKKSALEGRQDLFLWSHNWSGQWVNAILLSQTGQLFSNIMLLMYAAIIHTSYKLNLKKMISCYYFW